MRVRVGERAQSVVIFLASGIPKGELDVLAIDFDIGDVVLEDGGDVDLEVLMSAHRVHCNVIALGRGSLAGVRRRGETKSSDDGETGDMNQRTSGKVPLEKTLSTEGQHGISTDDSRRHSFLHEETGLSACTITDDNELATDFRHCGDGLTKSSVR
jgi:hypothetical protein